MPTKNISAFRSGEGFLRNLGGQERLLYLYSKHHPRHFCIVAEMRVDRSATAFIDAFRKVQARHTILNVCIEDSAEFGPGFFRTDRIIAVKFEELGEPSDWARVVEAELATPFPTDTGPLIRARILGKAKRWAVVFTVHHAIADALSAVTIIEDLMRALCGRDLPPPSVSLPLETLASRARADHNGSFGFDTRPGSSHQELRAVAAEPLWRPFEGDAPRAFTMYFEPATTTAILEQCRRHKTTLHGALCAALIMTAAVDPARQNFTITSPVNLRSMIGLDTRATGLLVGTGTVKFPISATLEFWSLARMAVAGLASARNKTGAFRALDMLQIAVPVDAEPELAVGLIGAMRYDAIISNLGRLGTATEMGDLRLDAVWGPFVQGRFRNECVIGAASLGGILRVAQTSPFHMPSCLEALRTSLLVACDLQPDFPNKSA